MRLALIGCGQVVERYHLPALSAIPELRVSCVVEASPERRRAIAPRFPGVMICAGLDRALEAGVADAALIATPPATHADIAQRCLVAGWHVLVEKPMAGSSVEAAAIVDAADRARRCAAVGFNRRFRRPWSDARRLLASLGSDGWDDAALTMAFDTTRWRSVASLQQEGEALTGLLEDVVPHQADLLAFLFDRPIVRVRAQDMRFRRGQSVELAYAVELRNGAVISCRARHGPGHLELLEARRGRRMLAVTPDDMLWAARWPRLSRRLAGAWSKAADAGRRVAGRPSATVTSFILQLRAFTRMTEGESAGVLADGAVGFAACAAGDALRASAIGRGTDWTMVEDSKV